MLDRQSSISGQKINYSAHIDGLRAISVTSVVAYHVGVEGPSGGFVGVDVFFVISGFLIIGHVISNLANGQFSFGDFWARRALRILPPYAAVLLGSCIIASFVLVLPSEVREFGTEVLFSAAMLSNHYFLEQQGYFDTASELKPMLHLWSLAVEEQFYLLAPVVLWASAVFLRRVSSPVLRRAVAWSGAALLFLISLAACVYVTSLDLEKSYSFFIMGFRIWEFIAGAAAIALIPYARRLPTWLLEIGCASGVGLILYSVFTLTSRDPYPSFNAVVPVLGAALTIVAASARPVTLTCRLLASPPFVAIGLLSYSWYLWHWPLLSFARIYNFGERHFLTDLAMGALSLLLAAATFFLVERPIKKWRVRRFGTLGWRQFWRGAAVSLPVFLVGASFAFALPALFEARIPQGMRPVLIPDDAGLCQLNEIDDPQACLQQAANRPLGLMIGDSHARTSYVRLSKLLEGDTGTMLAMISRAGCIAAFGVEIYQSETGSNNKCSDSFGRGTRWLEDGSIVPRYAILQSRWVLYAGHGRLIGFADSDGPAPRQDQGEVLASAVRGTIQRLQASGVQRVLIVAPVPEFSRSVPECLARAARNGGNLDRACSKRRRAVDKRRDETIRNLRLGIGGFESTQVRMIDPADVFCDDEWCRPFEGDVAYYRDGNHLSDEGVNAVYRKFTSDFLWAARLDNEAPVARQHDRFEP